MVTRRKLRVYESRGGDTRRPDESYCLERYRELLERSPNLSYVDLVMRHLLELSAGRLDGNMKQSREALCGVGTPYCRHAATKRSKSIPDQRIASLALKFNHWQTLLRPEIGILSRERKV